MFSFCIGVELIKHWNALPSHSLQRNLRIKAWKYLYISTNIDTLQKQGKKCPLRKQLSRLV